MIDKDEDLSLCAEIDEMFKGVTEEAAKVDQAIDSISAIIKQSTKSFNMKRESLSQTALGNTYLQGLPSKEAYQVIISGSVKLNELVPMLVENGNLRFRDARDTDIAAAGYLYYRELALSGLYSIELADAYAEKMGVARTDAIKEMAGIRPKKLVLDSIKGLTFAKGIKAYVEGVRVLHEQLELMLPRGTAVVPQLYPDSTLDRGTKELEAMLAGDFGLSVDEEEL